MINMKKKGQTIPSADTGIGAFAEKEDNVGMFIQSKIAKDTQKQEIVKTENVREGTEDIVDTSTKIMDATEEIAANTFTPTVEKQKRMI